MSLAELQWLLISTSPHKARATHRRCSTSLPQGWACIMVLTTYDKNRITSEFCYAEIDALLPKGLEAAHICQQAST